MQIEIVWFTNGSLHPQWARLLCWIRIGPLMVPCRPQSATYTLRAASCALVSAALAFPLTLS